MNDKSGWIFVNDPEVVGYCSHTNVGNYQLRFLPVRALGTVLPSDSHALACACSK